MADQTWVEWGLFRAAGPSGRGSYSYADPTVFGGRELPENRVVVVGYGNGGGIYGSPVSKPMIAGRGGGAKALASLAHGSHATGFNPNGLVVIRLTRIE